MRTHTYISICAGLLLAGCSKEEQKLPPLEAELLLEYNAIEFTVDSGTFSGPMELTLSFNGQELNDLLNGNGYSMDQLEQFTFTKAELHVVQPEQQSFDPLDAAALTLTTGSTGAEVIASIDPVPDGLRDLGLALSNVNVADLLRSPSAVLKLSTVINGTFAEPVLLRADLGGKAVVRL